MQSFNPTPIYHHVARNLLVHFGAHAMPLAERATKSLASAGDAEGADMWRMIRRALDGYASRLASTSKSVN